MLELSTLLHVVPSGLGVISSDGRCRDVISSTWHVLSVVVGSIAAGCAASVDVFLTCVVVVFEAGCRHVFLVFLADLLDTLVDVAVVTGFSSVLDIAQRTVVYLLSDISALGTLSLGQQIRINVHGREPLQSSLTLLWGETFTLDLVLGFRISQFVG